MLPILNSLNQSREVTDTFRGYDHTLLTGAGEFYDMQNLSSDDYPSITLRPRRKKIKGIDESLKCQVSCSDSKVTVVRSTFVTKADEPYIGDYVFTKVNNVWEYDGETVILADWGISWTVEPASPFTVTVSDTINGMVGDVFTTSANTNLWYVRGDTLLNNPLGGSSGIQLNYGVGERQLVPIGTYLTVFPDGKYVNLSNTTERGDINFSSSIACRIAPCYFDGSPIENADYTQADDPTRTQVVTNGQVWHDTTNHLFKKYSSSTMTWVILNTYINFSVSSPSTMPSEIVEGTNVTMSSITTTGIPSGAKEQLEALVGQTFVVQKATSQYFIILGTLDSPQSLVPVTVSRNAPLMDFVFECNNRLWGCRYGLNRAGVFVNEIYASKLGDFKTWYSFQGISTDSYMASCGVPGNWTGAIAYNGYPLFFKEDCLYKVYGDYPSNYQVTNTMLKGVQNGSDKSLAICNNVLYYKSTDGVCAYDGSLPTDIGNIFGDVKYSGAVAGAYKDKYYISMSDGTAYHLFVYDTKSKYYQKTSVRLWHREDNTQMTYCAHRNGDMVFAIASDNCIHDMELWGNTETEAINWFAETGLLGVSSPDHKYVNKIAVRMNLPIGSSIRFFIDYDSSGFWTPLGTFLGNSTRTFSVVLRPRRCDHFRLKIEGTNAFTIYSITKTLTAGSDER